MRSTRRRILATGAAGLAVMTGTAAAFADAAPPPRKLKILILGGTGFTGPHQVRYALSRGHAVTIFNRGRQHEDWPGPVEELIGDRNTGDLSALAGRDWDVCIDNPTTLPFWVRDAGKALAGHVGQYIFISTISVYASNAEPGADESAAVAPYEGKDAMAETQETVRADMRLYGPLKAASEAEARRQFGAAVTVIRPGLIVGPGDETDRFTYWPVRLALGGVALSLPQDVLAPGDGTDPVQIIDARDLAEWTIRMAEQRHVGTFNATGPAATLTMRDMLEGIEAGIQSNARIDWVPTKFLDAHDVSAWSDMPVWVPGQGDTAGFARRSIHAALAAGLTYRPLATTAADTLAWFRMQPAERQGKLKAGLTADREAQLLAAWKVHAPPASG